jgi:hypothetical protein
MLVVCFQLVFAVNRFPRLLQYQHHLERERAIEAQREQFLAHELADTLQENKDHELLQHLAKTLALSVQKLDARRESSVLGMFHEGSYAENKIVSMVVVVRFVFLQRTRKCIMTLTKG